MYWALYGDQEETEVFKEMAKVEEDWKKITSEKEVQRRRKMMRIFSLCFVVGLVFGVISTMLFSSVLPINQSDWNLAPAIIFFVIMAIGLVGRSFTRSYYYSKSKDVLKLMLAKENNWLYSSEKNVPQQQTLEKELPELFGKGNTSNKYIEDQFFGEIQIGKNKIPFNLGNFYYEVRSGHGKNQSTKSYYKNFFAFRPNNKLNAHFLVSPERLLHKIGNMLTKKDVDLESMEFNKKFVFSYKDEKNKALIPRIFTPTLQLNFLELEKKRNNFQSLITNGAIVFMFDGFLLSFLKTNILKENKISEADTAQLKNKIDELVVIIKEITKSFD
ncbi:MAG: hypothetical protein HOE11_01680 [Candidatus Diapherotrites archaeon]|nr:hypothetical protein [Candidatus Diapherotrites archaeon]MBT4596348.1 hypothetical protein [Candidatus Diapherotrites archaeon]